MCLVRFGSHWFHGILVVDFVCMFCIGFLLYSVFSWDSFIQNKNHFGEFLTSWYDSLDIWFIRFPDKNSHPYLPRNHTPSRQAATSSTTTGAQSPPSPAWLSPLCWVDWLSSTTPLRITYPSWLRGTRQWLPPRNSFSRPRTTPRPLTRLILWGLLRNVGKQVRW